MKQQVFGISFKSTELEARHAIRAVIERLSGHGLTEESAAIVELVLAEAVNNVVEHAFAGLEPGEVVIRYRFRDGRLTLSLCDAGHALPGGILPEGRASDVSGPRVQLPEGGFGWFLIRELTSSIHYGRRAGRNHLRVSFDLPQPCASRRQ